MIIIENIDIYGWEAAIRGMRNPRSSHGKSDSLFFDSVAENKVYWHDICGYRGFTRIKENELFDGKDCFRVGENDLELMKRLAREGGAHAKFRRMITVTMDITAPLYWWKEFDTYKVGTVANSTSTMNEAAKKKFTIEDFSCEHLTSGSIDILKEIVDDLNDSVEEYEKYDGTAEKDKEYYAEGINCKKDLWWQVIQLLPSSYNQKRTVQLNYEVLSRLYFDRKDHRLDEWREFCRIAESLPYGKELIALVD